MDYESFLGEVKDRAELDTTEEADKVTRATLETLGERLPDEDQNRLAAHLPEKIAASVNAPEGQEIFPLHEFYERVQKREGVATEEAVRHARAVAATLQAAGPAGTVVHDLKERLQPNYQELFGLSTAHQSPTLDERLVETARQYKSEFLERMFGVSAYTTESEQASGVVPAGSNIVGVGYGAKSAVGAEPYDELAVRVYVRAKLPVSALSRTEVVPQYVNGVPTDVIPVGEIFALARPTMCGVSCGHHAMDGAGTLGCLVAKRDGGDGHRYILSNNHVLANNNEASPGDPILEPGPFDGGDPGDPIAELTDYEPFDFSGLNSMDAAIARVLDPNDIRAEILGGIGAVQKPPMPAVIYQSVRKQGRTTSHTVGLVQGLSEYFPRVTYGSNSAAFDEQIVIRGAGAAFSSPSFSSPGDSGSLVVDAMTRRPVALLFAGGINASVATPIERVLDRFKVEVM